MAIPFDSLPRKSGRIVGFYRVSGRGVSKEKWAARAAGHEALTRLAYLGADRLIIERWEGQVPRASLQEEQDALKALRQAAGEDDDAAVAEVSSEPSADPDASAEAETEATERHGRRRRS